MIILDIDQDFFFHPVVSGSLGQVMPILGQKMVEGFDGIYNLIKDRVTSRTEILRFDTHDGVGGLILNNGFKDITLYHLDAHEDVGSGSMNECNWMSHVSGRCKNVYWIVNSKQYGDDRESNDKIFSTNTVPRIDQDIDLICWTQSLNWCPQEIQLFDLFLNYIKRPV